MLLGLPYTPCATTGHHPYLRDDGSRLRENRCLDPKTATPKDLNRSGHGQSLADHTDVRAVAVAVAVLRLLTYINLLLHEA